VNRHEAGRRRPSRRQASEDPGPKTGLELPSRKPSGADPRQFDTWSITQGLGNWAYERRVEAQASRVQRKLENRGSGKN
jgi:hypothetical protein